MAVRKQDDEDTKEGPPADPAKPPRSKNLADVDLSDPDAIRAYLLAHRASASRRWKADAIKLRYNEPGLLLRARVYQVGCKLLQEGKGDQLIAVLNNTRVGRGRSYGNVFSAVFGLLDGRVSMSGFTPSACRKAAAVMVAAYDYDIHPRYVTAFATGMKGWSKPIDATRLTKAPGWIRGLTREVQERDA